MRRRYLVAATLQLALASVLVIGLTATVPATRQAAAGTEVLPDLSMAPLSDFRIEWVNGRRMLRFTAMMVNVGSGHFEVRGSRGSTSDPMRVSQVIYESTSRTSPAARLIPTDAVGKWSGDGHDHWHVQEMMRYDLWGGAGTLRGAKVGFCFLDSDPFNLNLPGAGPSSYYRGSWCATTPSALSNRMGISVGWGDEYEYYLAWQWVDITDLPGGTYTLRSKVDPYGFFLEEQEGNQCAWATVSFTASSNVVTLVERHPGCVDDWSSSIFAGNIRWAFEQGITFGCSADLFCTNNPVTREQMASFLVRALDLPWTTNDYFVDDEGSVHETNINQIAEARISFGCGEDRFCPRATVLREQMASFLVRAFALPPTSTDYFTDDEDSIHEADINAVAAAGIAFGCTTTEFCPERPVTRGQMVAFLNRALGG